MAALKYRGQSSPTTTPSRSTGRPNLFIVGAAKAGTTSLHDTLGGHPEIFMSATKEPGFFAPDYPSAWGSDEAEYLRLFESSTPEHRFRGESSPVYLYSEQAAGRIREFSPEARIVIVLRNPLDAMVSVYAESRKWGQEPAPTFDKAFLLSERGRPRLERARGGHWVRYRRVVSYAGQVHRYLDTFPPAQVHIALYDDLVGAPDDFLRRLLGFLRVEVDYPLPMARSNPSFTYRSAVVQRLLMAPYGRPHFQRSATVRDTVLRTAARLNSVPGSPSGPSPGLRARLVDEFTPEIEELGRIIGRDLSHWLA